MAVNLRTLGARPCGACAALILESEGCPHWKKRPVISRRHLSRMLGGTQHDLLRRCSITVVYALGRRSIIESAHRLIKLGLLDRPNPGRYRITETGIEVLELLESDLRKLEGRE